MDNIKRIKYIFDHKPGQWGLRGDPYLWESLKTEFLQSNTELNSESFNKLLDAKFHEIIKNKAEPYSKDTVYIKEYPQEGMSGGYISLSWWEETGLPFLKETNANWKP